MYERMSEFYKIEKIYPLFLCCLRKNIYLCLQIRVYDKL